MAADVTTTEWRGGAHGRTMVVLAVLLMAAAVGMAPAVLVNDEATPVIVSSLVVTACAAFVLGFATVEVTIDGAGLHARTAPVAFYRQTIRMADIEGVRMVDHRTVGWGIAAGWGYRGSLRLFRRAAWVVRSGPALELDLRGGRRFTITVDDAATAADLLHARLPSPG
ncbi:MAG: hypothetical protein M3Z03_15530 [Actinomycetota bacterium]|nr:hypothetical protein [Actinomycetota bacterium]